MGVKPWWWYRRRCFEGKSWGLFPPTFERQPSDGRSRRGRPRRVLANARQGLPKLDKDFLKRACCPQGGEPRCWRHGGATRHLRLAASEQGIELCDLAAGFVTLFDGFVTLVDGFVALACGRACLLGPA